MKKLLLILLVLTNINTQAQTISLTRVAYQRGIDSAIRIAVARVTSSIQYQTLLAQNNALMEDVSLIKNSMIDTSKVIVPLRDWGNDLNSSLSKRLGKIEVALISIRDTNDVRFAQQQRISDTLRTVRNNDDRRFGQQQRLADTVRSAVAAILVVSNELGNLRKELYEAIASNNTANTELLKKQIEALDEKIKVLTNKILTAKISYE